MLLVTYISDNSCMTQELQTKVLILTLIGRNSLHMMHICILDVTKSPKYVTHLDNYIQTTK